MEFITFTTSIVIFYYPTYDMVKGYVKRFPTVSTCPTTVQEPNEFTGNVTGLEVI